MHVLHLGYDMNIDLEQYGWEDFFADAKKSSTNKNLEHGRIISVHKSRYEVVTKDGIFSCEILGNVQFQKNPLLLPSVGDWVLFDRYKDTRIIKEILPRKSILKRQKKHDKFPKPIAANINQAIIVQAVGPDFNIKRIDRILVHVYEANIEPLLIINKIDLAIDNLEEIKQELKNLNHNINVLFTSYKTGKGIDELKKILKPKETIVFIGSSGVGKSSIINSMLGENLQETAEITKSTGKGKHTTTARRLFKLNNGVLVVDTPGTREFGMHDDDQSAIKKSFEIIETLSKKCHFSNCSHSGEPDCAIEKALEEEVLDKKIYNRYLRLKHESSQTAKEMRQGLKTSRKKINQPLRSIRRGKTKSKRKK